MSAITDTTGAVISIVNLSLAGDSESAALVGRVPCVASAYLAASSLPVAQVFARRTGSGDSFADLSSSPIDLSPFAGSTIEFEFKIRTESVMGRAFAALSVRVTANP